MGLPGVTINVSNGNLGKTPSTDDGIIGMVLSGSASLVTAIGTGKAIFTIKEAETLGLKEDAEVWEHIAAFYEVAGDGAELWLAVVPKTMSLADMVDKAEDTAPKLLAKAKGRIRILCVDRVPEGGYSPDLTEGLDAEVYTALTKAQELAESETENINPLRVVIGGRTFSGDTSLVRDLKMDTKNRVQILLGSTSDSGRPAIGMLAGTYARIPVQRNIGRVKTGSLPIEEAFLSDGTSQAEHQIKVEALHKKGYVLIRSFVGKAGFYFTDDPTATSDADDFSSLARGRVIDKAFLLAYITYVTEVNDEIEVDKEGKMDAARLKELEANIAKTINQNMTAKGEISSVNVVIDPEQNVLATDRMEIGLNITPVGYLKNLVVNLGFENPFNS